MNSNNKVKTKDISLGDRAREDYGDLQELASSLKKHGQFHPIIITPDNQLIAGGRRLCAAMLNGWDYIEVKYYEDLSELEKAEIELDENLIRKDLDWKEVVTLKKRIDSVKKAIAAETGETWNVEKTAESIGETPRNTWMDIELANDMDVFPELRECKNKNEARTKARRLKSASHRKKLAALAPTKEITASSFLGIHKGDSASILRVIPDNSVDLILADPPFAIDFDDKERNDLYVTTYGDLKDTSDLLTKVVEPVIRECARVLKGGAHMFLFFGIQHYQKCYDILNNTGIVRIAPCPLLWVKKSGENYLPYNRFTVNYEALFYCYKYKDSKEEKNVYHVHREFAKAHNSTFEHQAKSRSKEHPAQKPLSLYKELISIVDYNGEEDIILDPFLGSGISGIATRQMGKKFIGIESVSDWYNLALDNYNKYEDYDE